MSLVLNYDELREMLIVYTRGIINSMELEKWVYKLNLEKKLPDYLSAPAKFSAFIYILNELKTNRPFDRQFSEDSYFGRARLFLDTLDEKSYFNDSIIVNVTIGEQCSPQIDTLLFKLFQKAGYQAEIKDGNNFFCEFDIEMFGENIRVSRSKIKLLADKAS